MRLRRPIQLCVMLLAVGLAGLAAHAAEEEEPLSLIERLHKSMKGIQAHVQNANVKLRGGMAGVAEGNETGGREPTPAERCCGSNIERINTKINEMVRTLEELDLYYADRANDEGLARLDPIRGELSIVSQGIAVFKLAGTSDSAGQALLGIIRPFNRLRTAVEDLERCCPTEKPRDSGRTKTDRKK